MAQTIKEMVYSTVSPEEVFESFYGLNHRERQTYEEILAAEEPLSVETIAERMDCSLSTAYRYVDALETHNLVHETGLYDGEYLKSGYTATEPAVIAEHMFDYVDFKYQKCERNIEAIANRNEEPGDCEETEWDRPGTFLSH
ncbi:HTH domain-containing protein [Halodesulfurarchaeum sp.]|uniref:HTH domain-containing protein n=1 Tax=Halodesulfurarchaeum sp. TaxID=1980530 RepID=UPI001BBAFE3D|nr:HTH domain-containing protein [Halodesulfurarchaeum sp.]